VQQRCGRASGFGPAQRRERNIPGRVSCVQGCELQQRKAALGASGRRGEDLQRARLLGVLAGCFSGTRQRASDCVALCSADSAACGSPCTSSSS
jgi:hypothetical protein